MEGDGAERQRDSGSRADQLGGHQRADARSLALHRQVAARLREQPALIEIARRRVAEWQQIPSSHPYAGGWQRLLDGPLDELLEFLESPDQEAVDHRQASPFAGVLTPQERWRVLREEPA